MPVNPVRKTPTIYKSKLWRFLFAETNFDKKGIYIVISQIAPFTSPIISMKFDKREHLKRFVSKKICKNTFHDMFSAWYWNVYQRIIIAGNLAFLEQQLGYYRTVFRLTINLMRLFATFPNPASARRWLKHTRVKSSAACLSTTLPLRPFLHPAWAQLYHCGPSCSSLPGHSCTIAALPADRQSTALSLRPSTLALNSKTNAYQTSQTGHIETYTEVRFGRGVGVVYTTMRLNSRHSTCTDWKTAW